MCSIKVFCILIYLDILLIFLREGIAQPANQTEGAEELFVCDYDYSEEIQDKFIDNLFEVNIKRILLH